MLREAWFLCRHFWLVQGGTTWEIEIFSASAANGWMDAEWHLQFQFATLPEDKALPLTKIDTVLHPQQLYADVENTTPTTFSLRVYMTDGIWKEIADPQARNLLPD